jgi:hypothetical protein
MLNVYLPAFYLGVSEELEKFARCWKGYEPVPGKEAYSEDSCRPKRSKKEQKEKSAFDVSSMPLNENILPNINSQSKWKYVRTKNGLRLSDGNLVYNFGGFPEEFPGEDFRVNRLKDDNILDFEKDSIGKGTAQIHRSSPDNIYMTLADGARNPTFMLQHEEGQNWRYSPSKKFLEKLKALQAKTSTVLDKAESSQEAPEYEKATLLDPESLFKGAEDFCKSAFDPMHPTLGLDSDDLSNIIKSVGYGANALGQGFINTATNHPIATGATLYGLTRGVSALRDMMSPERKAEREADPRKKLQHELGNIALAGVPTIAAAALGTK